MVKTEKAIIQREQLRDLLLKLHQELIILREQEAKFGGEVPLRLNNEIFDYETAKALTDQALRGELAITILKQELRRLLIFEETKKLCSEIISIE